MLMWGIDSKGLDLFLNSCQHSIINVAQKRNAILPPASSTQLSAKTEAIVFTIIIANVRSQKQLDFHTQGCQKHRHLVKSVFNFNLPLSALRNVFKGENIIFIPQAILKLLIWDIYRSQRCWSQCCFSSLT